MRNVLDQYRHPENRLTHALGMVFVTVGRLRALSS
jgi:hypothetical protein